MFRPVHAHPTPLLQHAISSGERYGRRKYEWTTCLARLIGPVVGGLGNGLVGRRNVFERREFSELRRTAWTSQPITFLCVFRRGRPPSPMRAGHLRAWAPALATLQPPADERRSPGQLPGVYLRAAWRSKTEGRGAELPLPR